MKICFEVFFLFVLLTFHVAVFHRGKCRTSFALVYYVLYYLHWERWKTLNMQISFAENLKCSDVIRVLSAVRIWSSSEGHCSDVTAGRFASAAQTSPTWLLADFHTDPRGTEFPSVRRGIGCTTVETPPPSNPDTIWFLLAALGLSVAPADAFRSNARVHTGFHPDSANSSMEKKIKDFYQRSNMGEQEPDTSSK